jgi:hypothetical protein
VFFYYFLYYLVCEAIGTAATPGLLFQRRVILKMTVEKQMECRLAGETEVLGENLSQRHFCPSQNPTSADPGSNPGRRCGKPATNRIHCVKVELRNLIFKFLLKTAYAIHTEYLYHDVELIHPA